MLTHIVLFKFKPETSQDQIDQLTVGLGTLPAQISEIKEFRVGRDVVRSERSYDLGLPTSTPCSVTRSTQSTRRSLPWSKRSPVAWLPSTLKTDRSAGTP